MENSIILTIPRGRHSDFNTGTLFRLRDEMTLLVNAEPQTFKVKHWIERYPEAFYRFINKDCIFPTDWATKAVWRGVYEQ